MATDDWDAPLHGSADADDKALMVRHLSAWLLHVLLDSTLAALRTGTLDHIADMNDLKVFADTITLNVSDRADASARAAFVSRLSIDLAHRWIHLLHAACATNPELLRTMHDELVSEIAFTSEVIDMTIPRKDPTE